MLFSTDMRERKLDLTLGNCSRYNGHPLHIW